MKFIFVFLLSAGCFCSITAQSVAINTDRSAAAASALLDIKSNNKGLLIPRTSTASRLAIVNPAKGLILYDTTAGSFWFYNGSVWNALSTGSATNFWTANGSNIYKNNSGNVGIGVAAPLAPLHIKAEEQALQIQGSTPFISFDDNSGVRKGFIQSYNDDLYFGTPTANSNGKLEFYTKNIPAMTINSNGDIGVGTIFPAEKLTVQTLNNTYGISHRGEGANILATRMGGTSAGIGTFSNTNMRIFSNYISAMFINASNAYVGIGIDFPTNKLQVGSIGVSQYSGNDFAIGNGTHATRMLQTSSASFIGSSTDILLLPKEGSGNVGINITDPASTLQIGSTGSYAYGGSDFVIGNGTDAIAISQRAVARILSSTNIVLYPNNGDGRVGINVDNPQYPLHVVGSVTSPTLCLGYFARQGNVCNGVTGGIQEPVPASIYASSRILASEFNAFSDARIKNVVGVSNGRSDLETINTLQIIDYTLKDYVNHGNKSYKKVIAQQVESVYPQVVSMQPDFIPNVYQVASSVETTSMGIKIAFAKDHTIQSTAKKLRVLVDGQPNMKEVNILEIPSSKEVVIDLKDTRGKKIFVYGEEVNDFRTVDYEGLTTLNISATQELSRLIEMQNKKIEALAAELKTLQHQLAEAMPKLTAQQPSSNF